MADIVAAQGISSIKIDYAAIGRAAGEILAANAYRVVRHTCQLSPGRTTWQRGRLAGGADATANCDFTAGNSRGFAEAGFDVHGFTRGI